LSRLVSQPTLYFMSDENEPTPLNRPRRTTLEAFNDEMAVLDRPLESEVEYYDEKPPARRGKLGAIVGVVLVLGSAGFLLLSRASARTPATPPLAIGSAAVTAPAPAPVVTPVEPVAPAPPAPPAPAQVAMNEVSPEADAPPVAMPRAAARGAWAKAAGSSHRESRRHHKHHSR
jgi:hypothetical protein